MQSEMPFYILRLLDSEGHVTIDGLGVFSLTSIPAYVDSNARKINPPHRTGSFQSGNQSDDVLPAFIHDKTGADLDTCKAHVAAFAGIVNKKTKPNAPFDIDAFGKFWRDPKGDLAFTPNAKAFNQRFVYFKALEIVPATFTDPTMPVGGTDIPPKVDQTQSQEMPKTQGRQEQEKNTTPEKAMATEKTGTKRSTQVRRRNLVFLLLLVFLILIAISWLFILDKSDPTELDTGRIMSLNELQKQTAETSDAISPPASDKQDIAETAEEDEPVMELEAEAVQESATSEQETPIPVFSGDVNSDDWQCLVVTGSFARTGNVERMIERLTSLGFAVRISKDGGLTRVGIPVECGEQNWGLLLDQVRTEVEPAAWIFNK